MQIYSNMCWIPPLFIMVTKVVWRSLIIQCFMTNRTTLRSSTISSKTWCRGRKYWCSTFLQMSRLLMFLPNQDEVQVLQWQIWHGKECLPRWEGVLMFADSWDILQIVLLCDWVELICDDTYPRRDKCGWAYNPMCHVESTWGHVKGVFPWRHTLWGVDPKCF